MLAAEEIGVALMAAGSGSSTGRDGDETGSPDAERPPVLPSRAVSDGHHVNSGRSY